MSQKELKSMCENSVHNGIRVGKRLVERNKLKDGDDKGKQGLYLQHRTS